MNDFVFEQSPWEAFLDRCQSKSIVSALTLLPMMESETDDTVEEAFQLMDAKQISLDLSQLPATSFSGVSGLRLKQEQEYVLSGLNYTALEESDPLRLYLEELAGLPSFGDEELLANQTAAGNQEAASALATLGLSRTVELAMEYVGHGILLMDLIQEANLGLWQAVQSFSGGNYAQYRDQKIHSALAKAVFLQSRANGLGQKMREALQDYKTTDEKLLMELGRNPSLSEIADQMHISLEEAETIRKMKDDALLMAKSQKDTLPKEEEPEEELAVEDTAYFQMRQRIEELLSQLSREDARLLTLRYGLENGLPLTPEETGKKMGLTVNEVTAREAAALAKLRN